MTTHVSRTALARVVVDKLLADPSDHASVMREAAAYLLEHGMTSDADALINDVATELFDRTGRLPVEVTSAQPLSDASRQQLVTFLQESTGARVVDLDRKSVV